MSSSNSLLLKVEDFKGPVNSVAISPDGTQLVSGSRDRTVKTWDAMTGKELQKLEGHTDLVLSVAISADATTLVSGSNDKTVRTWDFKTGKNMLEFEGHTAGVESVAISSTGTTVVSGSWDMTLRIWDNETGKELLNLQGHTGCVQSVAISPDGTTLVSGSDDKTLKTWDMKTGKQLQTLTGHTAFVNSVAIFPDGAMLASGSSDKTVRVWDIKSSKELLKLEGHTWDVKSVVISSDGTTLVSGSRDGTLRLWDAKTGRKLLKLEGHTAGVQSVAISSDGTRLVSGSHDFTMRTWKSRVDAPVTKTSDQPSQVPPNSTTTTSGGDHTASTSAVGHSAASSRHAVDFLPPVYIPVADFTKNFSPTKSCGEYLVSDAAQYFDKLNLVPLLPEIVQECGKITQSKLDCGSAPPELEPSQLFACVCYTFDITSLGVELPEENFYYQLNKVLQTRDSAKLKYFRGYLYYLMSGLRALPSHNGVVYRGLDAAGFEAVKEHYSDGMKIHWSGFSSTSEDLAFAKKMAGSDGVVFKIKVHTDAKKIGHVSILPEEQEVLLLPNFSAFVSSAVYVDSSTGMRICDLVEMVKEKKVYTF